MKKILLLLVLLMFCGCEPATQRKAKMSDGTSLYARRVVFEGHTYIEFARAMPAYDNYTGYVHDPECQNVKCRKMRGEE